jgi:hypothetical protein
MSDDVWGILEGVRDREPPREEVRAAADRIARLGEDVVPVLLEALEEEDEAILAVAAAALRRLASPEVGRQLIGLLQSSAIDPLAKALVLGVLEQAGMDMRDPSLFGAVLDVEDAVFPPTGEGHGPGETPRSPSGNGETAPPSADRSSGVP